MQPRLFILSQAFRSSRLFTRSGRPSFPPRISQSICRTCQSKFSTSSIWRQITQASKKAVQDAAKRGGVPEPGKSKSSPKHWKNVADGGTEYAERLVIYNAGDMRSSFVSFWKATAIFQFGLVAVFLAPVLYHNENQPDPNIRLLQAVGCKDHFWRLFSAAQISALSITLTFLQPISQNHTSTCPFAHLFLLCIKSLYLSSP